MPMGSFARMSTKGPLFKNYFSRYSLFFKKITILFFLHFKFHRHYTFSLWFFFSLLSNVRVQFFLIIIIPKITLFFFFFFFYSFLSFHFILQPIDCDFSSNFSLLHTRTLGENYRSVGVRQYRLTLVPLDFLVFFRFYFHFFFLSSFYTGIYVYKKGYF